MSDTADNNDTKTGKPPPSFPSQQADSLVDDQIKYGSDTSSLRLPQDPSVGSFRGLTIADNRRDNASTESFTGGLPSTQQTVAESLAGLNDESEEGILNSLLQLLRMVTSLSEGEIVQAWASARELLSTRYSPKVRLVAYDLYISFCVQYQHNALVVTQWLHKFGNPYEVEDHERLQIFAAQLSESHKREASLVHLLATLLAAWHKKAETARKQADQHRKLPRKSRDSPTERAIHLREDQDLHDLFGYAKAYVTLQQRRLSIADTTVFVQSLITISKTTTKAKDIGDVLDLVQVLPSKAEFSFPSLHSIMDVLCSIVYQVKAWSLRSQDIIGLFAAGPQRKEVISAMMSCVEDVKEKGTSKLIENSSAQGAVFVMQSMLNRSVIDYKSFDPIDILSKLASGMGKGHSKLEAQILVLAALIIRELQLPHLYGLPFEYIITILHKSIADVPDFHKADCAFAVLDRLLRHEKVEAPPKDDKSYPDFLLADKLQGVMKIHSCMEMNLGSLDQGQETRFFEYFMSLDARVQAYSSKLLVRYFLKTMNSDARRAALVYDRLLAIAESDLHRTENRLDCLRMLFRLRCDSSNRVWVLADTESEHIAAALYRTQPFIPRVQGSKDDSVDDSQSVSRSEASVESNMETSLPLWMYPGPRGLPDNPPDEPSGLVFANQPPDCGDCPDNIRALDMKRWLLTAMGILTAKKNWEVYSYVVVHLGAQLANMQLFHQADAGIRFLRNKVVEITVYDSYMEPPPGLKKANVAMCVFNIMTILISYHAFFTKDEEDQIVNCFVRGLGTKQGTASICIHALLICCLEIPSAFGRYFGQVLDEMSRIITQPLLSMHVLEFLSGFARSPELRKNIQNDEIRSIFGICIKYLDIARENKARSIEDPNRLSSPPVRQSRLPKAEESTGDQTDAAKEFPDYVFSLAFHVMNFWFLSMKLEDRVGHVGWLVRRLVFRDREGSQCIEEQSQVFIDMMQRTTFSDLGETYYYSDFTEDGDGHVSSKSWLVGHSIVTIETAGRTGKTQLIKRQASGTTHAMYQQRTAEIPAHHIPVQIDSIPETAGHYGQTAMLPSHIMLQLVATAAGVGSSVQPILLPDTPATERALRSFDKNPTVDSHGVGIIYIGPGQKHEVDILANTSTSKDFEQFLESIGTKVSLETAGLNTHGLSPETDGKYTYAWRDRLTEMVFHIPSMMPTDLEYDPQHNNKKRTIGNDFVKIIFNRSNLPFNFDTFPTQFNHVNILITPANFATISDNRNPFADPTRDDDLANTFYKVQCLTHDNIPNITAAAEPKVVSGRNVALLVRQITLNALLFALVWQHGEQSSRYTSRWRNRLQEIKRLRERVVAVINKKADEAAAEEATPVSTTGFFGGSRITRKAAAERTSLYPEDRELAAIRPVSNLDTALAGGNLADILDFSKWSS